MTLIQELKAEHQEIYKTLETFMNDLTKVKNEANHVHLEKSCASMLVYIKDLLDNHFRIEETELFPKLALETEKQGIITRLISDHHEIEEKYEIVVNAYEDFKARLQQQYFKDYDYKAALLFPAYNLIATINHHAAREDQVFGEVS